MTSDNPKVRRFEGRIPVKGFKIGYVLWIPFNERSIGYESQNIAIDPLSMTNYFDETIMCFHGWLDNANSYATLAPLLCTKFKNTRVISIDLPGHGKSSHSVLGYYDTTMFLTTYVRIFDKLHLNAFHIFGHSLSAVHLPYLIPVLEQSKKFIIKSVIFIEAFGSYFRPPDVKAVEINRLLPYKRNNIDIDDSDIDNDIKKLPKLYNSLDELVKSRIYVIEEVYPGSQTIGKETARLILTRNVGKIIVVESNTRKKQIKYYLRYDSELRNMYFTNTLGRIFALNGPQIDKHVIGKTKCPMLVVYGDNGYPWSYKFAQARIKQLNMD
eukprot:96690_1